MIEVDIQSEQKLSFGMIGLWHRETAAADRALYLPLCRK